MCHRFPFPPKRGGKIRPFNMIRHLSASHEVTVASLVRSDEEAREGEGLSKYCRKYLMGKISAREALVRMVARLPTAAPSSMGYFYSPVLARQIRQEVRTESFDLIFVHCSSAAQYVEDIANIPKILDFGDMDSEKWLTYAKFRHFPLSMGYFLEGAKLKRAEKSLAGKFDYCTCTTRAELATLERYQATSQTGWFPNGVDSAYFRPDDVPYDNETICFIGRMDYYPNQEGVMDFCKQTLPLIQSKRPGVKLRVVGANPSGEIRRLARIPGVTVTGSVPDVRSYVWKSAVTVAPLSIARGTQNKILESMAMGVPVVASVEAAGGVDAVPGEHLLSASSPEEYAEAILGLMDAPDERRRLSDAGRRRVLSHHDWAASMSRLDAVVEACMAGRR